MNTIYNLNEESGQIHTIFIHWITKQGSIHHHVVDSNRYYRIPTLVTHAVPQHKIFASHSPATEISKSFTSILEKWDKLQLWSLRVAGCPCRVAHWFLSFHQFNYRGSQFLLPFKFVLVQHPHPINTMTKLAVLALVGSVWGDTRGQHRKVKRESEWVHRRRWSAH